MTNAENLVPTRETTRRPTMPENTNPLNAALRRIHAVDPSLCRVIDSGMRVRIYFGSDHSQAHIAELVSTYRRDLAILLWWALDVAKREGFAPGVRWNSGYDNWQGDAKSTRVSRRSRSDCPTTAAVTALAAALEARAK